MLAPAGSRPKVLAPAFGRHGGRIARVGADQAGAVLESRADRLLNHAVGLEIDLGPAANTHEEGGRKAQYLSTQFINQ